MKNKSILIIISVLTLCIFAITGCSSSSKTTEETKASESTAQATAEKFLYEFYEVNSSKDAEDMQAPDNINKAHDKFKTVTTSKDLDSLIANRFYVRNLKFCSTNKCSVKATKIEFEKTFEDKKEGKFGFNYTASVEATYDKDQKSEKDTEKGYVGLIYEDNQWKVYSNSINNASKMLIKTK
ncbi:hypothetical protein [Clostridium folliculivorans]|uniref:DUF4829 domain-containing protein n=1 Tax=Clostridium folliculivorans TaxID=2886038 RepID=A0A9W5Y4Q3_9CLOT|nr:hypothetical protein [Clostridium folliculivorans]GKU26527.1 hypothetical protein CFOLD11_33540 [Clostridium folliculivorans]GKU29041.1 hypothetical protein CFB3_11470 [Clostridium folliculivorans]